MADSLPSATAVADGSEVDGPSGMVVEGAPEASLASARVPRELFNDDRSPDSHENPASGATGAVMEPLPASASNVLPPEGVVDVPEGTHNKETPLSELTASPPTVASPDSIKSPKARRLPNFENMESTFAKGYDSDGENPPTTAEEDFDEPPIKERTVDGTEHSDLADTDAAEEDENPVAQPNVEPRHIDIDEAALLKMTSLC